MPRDGRERLFWVIFYTSGCTTSAINLKDPTAGYAVQCKWIRWAKISLRGSVLICTIYLTFPLHSYLFPLAWLLFLGTLPANKWEEMCDAVCEIARYATYMHASACKTRTYFCKRKTSAEPWLTQNSSVFCQEICDVLLKKKTNGKKRR